MVMNIFPNALFLSVFLLAAPLPVQCAPSVSVAPHAAFKDDERDTRVNLGPEISQSERKPENTAYCAVPNFQILELESEDTGIRITGKIVRAGSKTIDLLVNGKIKNIDIEDLTEESQMFVRRFQVRGKIDPLPLSREATYDLDAKGIKSYSYTRNPLRKVNFLLYSPKGAGERGREFPLILFLHGTGGCGNDNFKPWKTDAGGIAQHLTGDDFQKHMPCYIMIPQAQNTGSPWLTWDTSRDRPLADAVRAIDTLKAGIAPNIDMRRLYLTGLSAGAYGCFDALVLFPGKFAAAVPVAGVAGYETFADWNVRPVWMSFNRGDKQIYYPNVTDMKTRFAALKAELKIHILEGSGHDAWRATYENQDFRKWLQHKSLTEVTYPADWHDPVK